MKKLIIVGVPHHGNLGDNAIALAEEMILKQNFPQYSIFQIPEKYLCTCIEKAKKYISKDDIILLHGGGNIGDTYLVPEEGRRKVIQLFPENKIIIFPQTAYFENNQKGMAELEISKKIYNNHKKLIILAREEKSYMFMKEHFYNAKVHLTPDIVMTMREKGNSDRKNITFLFRADKEKTLTDEELSKIKEVITNKYGEYILSDMHLGEDVLCRGGAIRKKALEDKFNQFQSSKLVITDRLHGMIFAAITETPCIVLGSFNHKISESYKWLSNLEYIKFCDDINSFQDLVNKLANINNIKYDNTFAKEIILDILNKEIP